MLIDNLELQSRMADKRAKREREIYQQRLADLASMPIISSNPTASAIYLLASYQRAQHTQ